MKIHISFSSNHCKSVSEGPLTISRFEHGNAKLSDDHVPPSIVASMVMLWFWFLVVNNYYPCKFAESMKKNAAKEVKFKI